MRLELEHVTKRFATQVVLSDVNLRVESGSRVAVVGPNGSGKSTLLRILMGLLSCEGLVRVGGRSPFEERDAIARQLAYVPQIAPQLGATVREIVASITMLRDLRADDVKSRAVALGVDWNGVQAKPFRNLSGGTKQKMLLSLAFASAPKLLILDEPTASLDSAARETFVSMLSGVAHDCTVLLCSHRPDDLQKLTGGIVELSEGRVARSLALVSADGGGPPHLEVVRRSS